MCAHASSFIHAQTYKRTKRIFEGVHLIYDRVGVKCIPETMYILVHTALMNVRGKPQTKQCINLSRVQDRIGLGSREGSLICIEGLVLTT